MKRIILSLLFMCCVLNAYGVAIITPESSLCRVSEAIPANCDSIRTDVSCNMLCPLKDYGDMTLGVSPVCEEEYYRNCVKYCNVSCKYRCPDNMYGTVTAINAGDSIQINGVNCTVCPTGAGVLSCGGALSVFSESGTTITATSKLTCKIGYTELNGKCVTDSSTIQCPEGQYLHTYNGVTACAPCPGNATCVNDVLTCDAGYYKYTGLQSPNSMYFCCLNNATCDDTGNFSYCNAGYYGNATNGCTKCPTNAICDANGVTGCVDGYVLESGACAKCSVGEVCTNGVFGGCAEGFYGSGRGTCKICPANAICSTTAITSCLDGYILESDACNKCLGSEVCEDGKFSRCADGYYGSGRGNCKVCPTNGNCTGGVFNGCNSEFYGNLDAGCRACPAYATCDGSATFKCDANYFKYTNKTETGETETGCEPCGISRVCSNEGECLYCKSGYYGECEDGCTKCPTLDKRPGTSEAKALDGTYSNTSIESCYVTVKDEDNVGNVSDSKGRLNDGIGTYYFREETCYATDINK